MLSILTGTAVVLNVDVVVRIVDGGKDKSGTDRTLGLPKFVEASFEISSALTGLPISSESSLMSLLYCEMSFWSSCLVRSISDGFNFIEASPSMFSFRIPLIRLMLSPVTVICSAMASGDFDSATST